MIALAFFGLTGKNSGQPDVGAALAHAAEVLHAAAARAMIRGPRWKELLGPLGVALVNELVSVVPVIGVPLVQASLDRSSA